MAYALRHVAKPVHLIDGLAGMLVEQSSMISSDDLLFAISFHPYARETGDIVQGAKNAGASVIAISDSQLSPVSRDADVSFDIKVFDHEEAMAALAAYDVDLVLVFHPPYFANFQPLMTLEQRVVAIMPATHALARRRHVSFNAAGRRVRCAPCRAALRRGR